MEIQDENGNLIPDGLEDFIPDKVESKISKYLKWINSNLILIIVALIAIASLVVNIKLLQIDHKTIIQKVQVVETLSQSVKKDMNIFAVDLNTMRFQKDIIKKSSVTGKDIYGVWRKSEKKDGGAIYTVVYEPLDDLTFNKKEYTKYLSSTKKD